MLSNEPLVASALEVARAMAAAGIPVFAAPPAPGTKVGFRLPQGWQRTVADPVRVDEWQPGWALCMVCGHGLDGIDVDFYAGGMLDPVLDLGVPRIWGKAVTPSGGVHLLIRSLGERSKNGLFTGVDIKSGDQGGNGRGFLFLAPTVKASKTDGVVKSYAWVDGAPGNLAEFLAGPDDSGRALAVAVRQSHDKGTQGLSRQGDEGDGENEGDDGDEGDVTPVTPEQFMAQPGRARSPWNNIAATLSAEGRNNGVMRLAASLREMTALTVDEAIAYMYERAWPFIDQHQGGHGFPEAEFEEVIHAVWRQYPGAAEKIEQAVAATADLAAHPLPSSGLELTDAYVTDRAAFILQGRFCWARGLGWMKWNGQRWAAADESEIWDDLRKYFIWLLGEVAAQPGADAALMARLTALLTAARVKAVASLCRGHLMVLREPEAFDRHPDLLNTPGGVVSLKNGSVRPHDPHLMLTKVTRGNYRPGFTHPDWEAALSALDEAEQNWMQARCGQSVTGHPPSDGVMVVLQGGGKNGKSCLTSDGLVPALGDYAQIASPKLITQHRPGASEHSTEMADLRGQRLLIGEELNEGRSIDVTALKRIQDVGVIKARYVHKDNISFTASHTLMVTTNYIPVIAETDYGTWRRLALLRFRYSFHEPGEPLNGPLDRAGDPGLKKRVRGGEDGQHDAIVTWAVTGAIAWYAHNCADAVPPKRVREDTRDWRTSSDHILGFWDEFLEKAPAVTPDTHPGAVLASHLHAVFNAWLGSNGHNSWSHQTFASRFGEHEETVRNRAEHRKTKQLGNLSWATGSDPAQAPKEAWAWVGIRFRKDPENALTSGGDGGDEGRANPPYETSPEKFGRPPSPLSPPSLSPLLTWENKSPLVNESASKGVEVSQSLQPPLGPVNSSQPVTSATLVFDLETASADDLFTYTQRDETGYVRLAGVRGPSGASMILTAPELIPLLESVDRISGHNVLGFDLLALARHYGADYDRLAAKALDTELVERQANPPRSRESGSSLDSYGLDAVAQRLGVPGKTDDAKRLARKHGGWDKIPLDDTEFRSYLEGDLAASSAVFQAMTEKYPADPYVDREHKLAAIAGRMTLNGFLVDRGLLERRLAEGQAKKRDALQILHDGYGLPLTRIVWRGRGEQKTATEQDVTSPLSTDAGRAWLAKVWEDHGLTDPPRTAKAQKLSIGIDDLKAIRARRPDLAPLCALMAVVTGTRTVYATAADCLAPDGRVHPGISFRQASGRWSVTNPGLTVFGKRGGRHHERDVFLPDPGHVLISADLSQVDMRSLAWLSQDHAYRALFAPGKDAHQEIADQVGVTRQDAKAIGHGWNYGLGAKRMIENGLDPKKVSDFISGMEARFPRLIAWRESIREQGKAGEILLNGFGRRMRADPARAYTVAPALMGQGCARDVMCQSLLRLPESVWPYLRVMVHDEILLSSPRDIAEDVARTVKTAMTWDLDDDLPVLCDLAFGRSWGECSAH
jgi:P4 family phage/plasmid primase-like protien